MHTVISILLICIIAYTGDEIDLKYKLREYDKDIRLIFSTLDSIIVSTFLTFFILKMHDQLIYIVIFALIRDIIHLVYFKCTRKA